MNEVARLLYLLYASPGLRDASEEGGSLHAGRGLALAADGYVP